ncbi:NUDIX domain-containing protein [Aurantivibrio plasticivorans]
MTTEPSEFHSDDVEIVSRDVVFKGFFQLDRIALRHKLFDGGWGREVVRELFIRGEAIGVLLYDPVHDLIGLVEQFRVGALNEPQGPWCLEVVAGMIEPGETAEEVVERELQEEANIKAEHLEYICDYLTSPGGTNEKLHLFCGYCDLSQAGGVHGLAEEDEDIRVCVLPSQDVFDTLYDGRCGNAASLITLQWLQLNRERIRRERQG